MRGFVAVLTILALTVAGVPGAAAAAPVDDGCTPPETAAGGGGEVEPGQQLAGVLGQQQSAVEGEIDGRGFEARLDNATSTAERARVVAAELKAIVERLATLEEGCKELTDDLDANEIGEDTYRTRMGRLDARVGTVSCRLDRTRIAAEGLPSDLRDEHGINETAFETVRERVDALDEFVGDEARATDGGAASTPAETPTPTTTTATPTTTTTETPTPTPTTTTSTTSTTTTTTATTPTGTDPETTDLGAVGASAGETVDASGAAGDAASLPDCGVEAARGDGSSTLPW